MLQDFALGWCAETFRAPICGETRNAEFLCGEGAAPAGARSGPAREKDGDCCALQREQAPSPQKPVGGCVYSVLPSPCQCLRPIKMKRSCWVILAWGVRCSGSASRGGSMMSGRVANTLLTIRR